MKRFLIGSVILTSLLLTFTNRGFGQKYLFYLHGRIVEDQGSAAVSNEYGRYDYQAILDSFRKENFVVISEVRKQNTDVREYARKVAAQADSLMKKGVNPSEITIVGASKGCIIAMLASSFLKNENVNFVFMAACSEDNLKSFPEINFCGNILSIYEKSDVAGTTCIKFKIRSALPVTRFREIEINTGLRHGFLYRPLPEWMIPAMMWAKGKYN